MCRFQRMHCKDSREYIVKVTENTANNHYLLLICIWWNTLKTFHGGTQSWPLNYLDRNKFILNKRTESHKRSNSDYAKFQSYNIVKKQMEKVICYLMGSLSSFLAQLEPVPKSKYHIREDCKSSWGALLNLFKLPQKLLLKNYNLDSF